MHISAKIDFKKYVLFSSILLIISYFLSRNFEELKVMLTIFLAACLNQYMLVKGVEKVTNQAAGNGETDKSGLIGLFIGKAIVLIVALTLGVQIMGKRIIIPVLIYVLQIVVLYLSMKKPVAEQGSNK
ncbi:hypothetical protein C8D79_1237 [Bacteriovorax stolpii]|nr:hypothetical protein [Bacteriovorax stolpii]TDP53955.1 hypothetical protein C8D79_1237 [Bacteriovorax stolpii]